MAQNPVVTIEMENGGIITAELYPEIAPESVRNFVSLCRSSITLVMQLFSLRKTDLQFHAGILQVNGKLYKGVSVLLDLRIQFVDLPAMHQQPPGPERILIEDIALLIRRDMHTVDKHLAVFKVAEGILQIDLSLTNGLDLGADEFDAGFVTLLNEIIMECLWILRTDLDSALCHAGTSLHLHFVNFDFITDASSSQVQTISAADYASNQK